MGGEKESEGCESFYSCEKRTTGKMMIKLLRASARSEERAALSVNYVTRGRLTALLDIEWYYRQKLTYQLLL